MIQVVFLTLACFWTVGCVALPLWCAWYLYFEDRFVGMALAVLLLGWPVGCFMGTAPWMMRAENKSPILATLHKGQWACTAAHTSTSTTYVKSGSAMVPVTTSRRVCDQYSRSN